MKRSGPDTLGFLVGDVSRSFRRRFEAALASAGLEVTVAESRTLFHAARQDGMRQAALAERMGIEPMTLVNFLDRLEGRGFVTREPDPSDRRAKIVKVTPAAQPLLERLEVIARGVRRQAVVGLSERDMEIVGRALEHMRNNLSASVERAVA
jgi:MarR family transcriptional regulator, transcriptional regulator for hemolysin